MCEKHFPGDHSLTPPAPLFISPFHNPTRYVPHGTKDHTGGLSKEILRRMIEDVTEKQQGHKNVDDVVVDRYFDIIDTDGNGELDYEEFKAWWRD